MPRTQHRLQSNWCRFEMAAVDFGDPRLNHRFLKTVGQLAEHPSASINSACDVWANAKGAYRMFDNDRILPQEILRAHHDRLVPRIDQEPFVFAIQDTTFLNYTDHLSTQGLGFIGSKNRRRNAQGLLVHTTLGVGMDGLPLGIVDQQVFARSPQKVEQKLARDLAIEDKESFKWLKAARQAQKVLSQTHSEVVHIADREGDVYEFMSEVIKERGHFLVRASSDRRLNTDDESYEWLWKHMKSEPVCAQQVIEVPKPRGGHSSRVAHLEIRFSKVRISPPKRKKKPRSLEVLAELEVYAVWINEPHPPPHTQPLEWMLLGDIEVTDARDAIERMNWYKLRWRIEDYHKVLKTDCRVETCRLETIERLERYLAIVGIIAWRILWLTHINRTQPDAKATQALQDHEWKALYCKIHHTNRSPSHPPTIRQAVRWIAQLGGFLGRKGDKEPGLLTICRGWQRLMDIADAYLIFTGATCG